MNLSREASPVPGVNWQRCWDEVTRCSSVPLNEQISKYQTSFAPWRASVHSLLDVSSVLEILEVTGQDVLDATSFNELQRPIIIRNANEFRLRDTPTLKDFEVILRDYKRWHKMPQSKHYAGGSQSRKLVLGKVDLVLHNARGRFGLLQEAQKIGLI